MKLHTSKKNLSALGGEEWFFQEKKKKSSTLVDYNRLDYNKDQSMDSVQVLSLQDRPVLARSVGPLTSRLSEAACPCSCKDTPVAFFPLL